MTTAITRDLLKVLRADIDAALVAVAQKHGLIIAAGNASFSDTSATFKLQVGIPSEGQSSEGGTAAIKANKAREDWEKYAKVYGCDPAWLGKSYAARSKVFTVMGLMPSRDKNCILIHDQNGKPFVTTPESVRVQLALAESAASAGLTRR